MQDLCFLLVGGAVLILVFYLLLELHYFFRSLICVVGARFFKKKTYILDETNVTGICLSNDIDYLLDHMNNARYLRELDFAKIDFYERTGLYRTVVSKGGAVYAGATTIRYRRFIKLFNKYRISTKIVYWDSQNVYLEHRFITSNGFVNAIALCRCRLVKVDAEEVMAQLIQNPPKNAHELPPERRLKPALSAELERWIESNQISSERLKNEDKIDNRPGVQKV